MKTTLKTLSLSNGRLLPLAALLTLGAISGLRAADASTANRREFRLGPDSIKLYDPQATPAATDKPAAGQPANGQPGATAAQSGNPAAPILPPILVAPTTPLPPPPVSDRRAFSSPDGGLLLNPKAVRIGSESAPATAPSNRREFKIGGP